MPPESLKAKFKNQSLAMRLAELFRFGMAGLATEVFYLGLLWLSGMFGPMQMWIRATLAYAGSIGANYTLQRTYTFRSRKAHSHSGPRYIAVQFVGLVINSSVLWLTVDKLHWPFIPSQVGAIAMVAAWSYVGQKVWAF